MRPIKPRKQQMHLSSAERTVMENEVTQYVVLLVMRKERPLSIERMVRRKFPNASGLVVRYVDDNYDFAFKV